MAAFAAFLASFFSRFVSLGGTAGRVSAESITESDSKPSIWSSRNYLVVGDRGHKLHHRRWINPVRWRVRLAHFLHPTRSPGRDWILHWWYHFLCFSDALDLVGSSI
jgi:hypothetical protein